MKLDWSNNWLNNTLSLHHQLPQTKLAEFVCICIHTSAYPSTSYQYANWHSVLRMFSILYMSRCCWPAANTRITIITREKRQTKQWASDKASTMIKDLFRHIIDSVVDLIVRLSIIHHRTKNFAEFAHLQTNNTSDVRHFHDGKSRETLAAEGGAKVVQGHCKGRPRSLPATEKLGKKKTENLRPRVDYNFETVAESTFYRLYVLFKDCY